MASCASTDRELSFEWSHHRISSKDSKVRVTLQNSIEHSGSERVKLRFRHIIPFLRPIIVIYDFHILIISSVITLLASDIYVTIFFLKKEKTYR